MHALAGFGAAALSPVLFGLVLDLAGGSGRGAAWLAAIAAAAVVNALWPLAYLRGRLDQG
ncbi:MAG TPA: hypothetical protein VM755_03515 [Stellaceae bacterium]|nr:hypothetical protein [Stellaceae bacterium]